MRRLALLFIIFFTFLTISAQQFDVQYGQPIEKMYRTKNNPVPGGGFVGIRRRVEGLRKTRINIMLFDKNMVTIKEREIETDSKTLDYLYAELKTINNKLWLIYTEMSSTGLSDFKAVEINPVTLELGNEKTLVTVKEFSKKNRWLALTRTEFRSSPDGKHHCLFLAFGFNESFLASFDEKLSKLWIRKDLETDIGRWPMNIDALEIDNAGNIFMSYWMGIFVKGYRKGDEEHIAIYQNANAPKILNVELNNGSPMGAFLLFSKNSPTAIVVGCYFEGSKNMRGVYKGTINTSSFKIENISQTPFPDDLVKLFDKDSWGNTKPDKYGIEPTFTAKLFEVDENTTDMVMEMKNTGEMSSGTSVLFSGNILNVYFDNSKTYFTRIPKYNNAVGTRWNHYYAIPFKRKMIIFYNDNPVNLARDINESPKLVNIEDNSVLVAAVINPDGTVKRQLPLDIKEKYMAIAEWIDKTEESVLKLPLIDWKKKDQYVTIAIK